MNGMERLTDTAARHGWTRDQEFSGWSRLVRYRRGDQWIEATRTVDGRVTRATRSWGGTTIVVTPRVAEQAIVWMTEPASGEETDRGRIHVHALENGWTYVGFTGSGRSYSQSTRRITVVCDNAGGLLRAQRSFGGPGVVREFHTNLIGNILPWFGPEPVKLSDRQTANTYAEAHGWTVDGGPLEQVYVRRTRRIVTAYTPGGMLDGAPRRNFSGSGVGSTHLDTLLAWLDFGHQEAAPPPIRSALPNTPDRKLERLLEDLEARARTLSQELEGRRIRPEGLGDWVWGEDALTLATQSLEELEDQVREGRRLAAKLWRERTTGGE